MSSYRRTRTKRLGTTEPEETTQKVGVHYLRVSSVKQTHTAADVDRDGNSIATQREECDRKAASMSVPVTKEFVEPGKSAQTIEKRPEFRRLLAYLAEHPEVGYVFVYARSRAFRNVEEAILTRRHLRGLGVKIISTKEDFGDSMEADFMEVISDSMNDLQNKRSGEDIKMKMAHKAKNGGTLGRAPIGYLNVRKDIDGRQVNTIDVDEQRAPLVRLAFELYATGDYTLEALAETMEDHGLRSRRSSRWPADRPLSRNTINKMLGDPYYAGHIFYAGEIYPGRHQAIVSQALFDQVQDVLDQRSAPGRRDRVLKHYLKGMLRCDRCRRAGRTSRLIYTECTGNGGTYGYFVCRGKQRKECDLPLLPAAIVEDRIAEHYKMLRITDSYRETFLDALDETLAEHQSSTRELHANLEKELGKLSEQEDRLIDALAEGTISSAKLRERIAALQLRQARVRERASETKQEIKTGVELVRTTLNLCREPYELYVHAGDIARGQTNQAFYKTLFIDEHGSVAEADLTPPFLTIQAAHQVWLQITGDQQVAGADTASETPPPRKQRSVLYEALSRAAEPRSTYSLPGVRFAAGLSRAVMVGMTGFEPATP